MRAFELRRCRYIGLKKTTLQHIITAAVINVVRLTAWLRGEPLAQTRKSSFATYLGPNRCLLAIAKNVKKYGANSIVSRLYPSRHSFVGNECARIGCHPSRDRRQRANANIEVPLDDRHLESDV
ncbi:MAG: transposase [Microcoleus sp.]